MTEPNCDMPWEIYLDWLEDHGISDLRFIEMGLILSAVFIPIYVFDGGGGETNLFGPVCTGEGTLAGLRSNRYRISGDGEWDGGNGRGDSCGYCMQGNGDDWNA